jgi:hypothetical protein
VPDYFGKITTPIDLRTMERKMDRNEYATEQEFMTVMDQIFRNCYTYWLKGRWTALERLLVAFKDKYSEMNRWIARKWGGTNEVATVPRIKDAS